MHHRIILSLVLVTFAACSGKKERPDEALVEESATEAEEPTFEHPDPGPVLVRSVGATQAVDRGTSRATADAVHISDRHAYVRFDVPDDAPFDLLRAHLLVVAEPHGVAFASDEGGRTRTLVVRFASADVPPTFAVRWAQADHQTRRAHRRAGVHGVIEVSVPDDATREAALEQRFWQGASSGFADMFRPGGASDPFFEFASARLSRSKLDEAQPRRRARTSVEETMDLYSGLSSVDEALQADRGLGVRGPRGERTVPIGDLEGVPLPGHPWKAMIDDLDEKPKVEPLASLIPVDMAYLHFDDLRTFVRLLRDLDDWVSPVAQWMEQRPGASHFLSAYERQLVIERTGVAEMLGHVAVSEMAVVTSDPFLREGTDVSIVFRVKNRTALLAALQGFEANTRRRRPDLRESTWKVGGTEVRRIFTADGEVDQHRVEYGDVLVISNSPGAVRHLVDAHAGKTPTLAASGDFRYMRARYPWGRNAEDGFLFLSDAFVAHAVGPRTKILESRRVSARADIQAVNHAALLFGWLEGRAPADAEELTDSRYLDPEELRHADGTEIAFDPETGARSSWGTARRLTPIRDLQLDRVSAVERDAYARFREGYQNYWRRYIDPIAVRITRPDDGSEIALDARMLPLIDASEYDEVIAVVGDQKVLRPRIEGGAQWTFAVGKDAELRDTLDGMARSTVSGEVGIGWLGQWVMAGVADRSGLWDLALVSGEVPQADDGAERAPMWAMTPEQRQAVGRFPLYVGAHIANKVGLVAVLAAMKKWVEDAAPGMLSWGQGEPYRDVPVVRVAPTSSGAPSDIPGELALHYTTVGDVFVAALERETLEIVVDRVLDGKSARPATGPPSDQAEADAQTFLDIAPGEGGWMARALIGLAEGGLIENQARALSAWTVLRRGLPEAKLDEEGTRRFGLAYLGYEPRNPNGGRFQTTPRGWVTHSLYGSSISPTVPELPIPGSPVTRVANRLARLSMSLDFEGEGEHRALRSTLQWRWKVDE